MPYFCSILRIEKKEVNKMIKLCKGLLVTMLLAGGVGILGDSTEVSAMRNQNVHSGVLSTTVERGAFEGKVNNEFKQKDCLNMNGCIYYQEKQDVVTNEIPDVETNTKTRNYGQQPQDGSGFQRGNGSGKGVCDGSGVGSKHNKRDGKCIFN